MRHIKTYTVYCILYYFMMVCQVKWIEFVSRYPRRAGLDRTSLSFRSGMQAATYTVHTEFWMEKTCRHVRCITVNECHSKHKVQIKQSTSFWDFLWHTWLSVSAPSSISRQREEARPRRLSCISWLKPIERISVIQYKSQSTPSSQNLLESLVIH